MTEILSRHKLMIHNYLQSRRTPNRTPPISRLDCNQPLTWTWISVLGTALLFKLYNRWALPEIQDKLIANINSGVNVIPQSVVLDENANSIWTSTHGKKRKQIYNNIFLRIKKYLVLSSFCAVNVVNLATDLEITTKLHTHWVAILNPRISKQFMKLCKTQWRAIITQ